MVAFATLLSSFIICSCYFVLCNGFFVVVLSILGFWWSKKPSLGIEGLQWGKPPFLFPPLPQVYMSDRRIWKNARGCVKRYDLGKNTPHGHLTRVIVMLCFKIV